MVGSAWWDWILFLWLANYLHSVLSFCGLGLLTCKSVSQITYVLLVETLNPALSYSFCASFARSCRVVMFCSV